MPRYEKVRWSFTIRKDVLERAKECSALSSISLNSFIAQAVSSAVLKWRDPMSGRMVSYDKSRPVDPSTVPELEGWTCEHGSHGNITQARDCPYKWNSVHRVMWSSKEYPKQQFDEVFGDEVVKKLLKKEKGAK